MDEFLGNAWSVGIGRIDEIDLELREALQSANDFRSILWRSPDSMARNAHATETQTIDAGCAADPKCTRLRGCNEVGHGTLPIGDSVLIL
jgi:hypothetical protein